MNSSVSGQNLARLYQKLVAKHDALTHRRGPAGHAPAKFRGLINGYLIVLLRSRDAHTRSATRDLLAVQRLLGSYGKSRQSYTKRQRGSAEDFNLIDVLQVTNDERRHSAMLAWLLDHRIEHLGTHAQDRLGFQLFLKELDLPRSYAGESYWVRCEVAGDQSRVDIEVAARGRFIIHIENKVRAQEGENQTNREWGDLQSRAKALGISISSRRNAIHAIFLSRGGDLPENPNFLPISWSRIAGVLETFAAKAEATDVGLFAAHYAKALRRFTVSKTPIGKIENEKEMVE